MYFIKHFDPLIPVFLEKKKKKRCAEKSRCKTIAAQKKACLPEDKFIRFFPFILYIYLKK